MGVETRETNAGGDEPPVWDERRDFDAQWDPWTPDEVAARLAGVGARWYVVAGWALDLFREEQTREHDDIEIGVPSEDFPLIRAALGNYELDVVGSGARWPLDSPAFDVHFQTWVREPVSGLYRLDVFRDPHDGDVWVCRRDHSIRRPYDEVIRFTPCGIPYMSPEIALLFKAMAGRAKDRLDFEGVLSLLEDEQVDWLSENVARIHPRHPWLGVLMRERKSRS